MKSFAWKIFFEKFCLKNNFFEKFCLKNFLVTAVQQKNLQFWEKSNFFFAKWSLRRIYSEFKKKILKIWFFDGAEQLGLVKFFHFEIHTILLFLNKNTYNSSNKKWCTHACFPIHHLVLVSPWIKLICRELVHFSPRTRPPLKFRVDHCIRIVFAEHTTKALLVTGTHSEGAADQIVAQNII